MIIIIPDSAVLHVPCTISREKDTSIHVPSGCEGFFARIAGRAAQTRNASREYNTKDVVLLAGGIGILRDIGVPMGR